MGSRIGALSTTVAIFLILSVSVASAEPAVAPGAGFDQVRFLDYSGDNVTDTDGLGSTPYLRAVEQKSASWSCPSHCRFWVDNTAGVQYFRIEPAAVGEGDLGFYREFDARPGETYLSTATIRLFDVGNAADFFGRLTLAAIGSSGQLMECNTLLRASRDGGTVVEVPAEVLEIPPCTTPPGTQRIQIKVRAHSETGLGYGSIAVHEFSFRRAA